MTRYVTKHGMSDFWEWARATDYLPKTVHVDEDTPVKTGLLDASGTPIYRVSEREPAGFVRHAKVKP